MKSSGKTTIYIAGPMRGYEEFNFPAFDEAKQRALEIFDEVISPADLDRADRRSLDHLTELERQKIYAERDVRAILSCTHIAMLPGWEKSKGATAEYRIALWIGLEVLDATNFEPLEEKDVINA